MNGNRRDFLKTTAAGVAATGALSLTAASYDRDMIRALKDAGGKPRYDEYPGVGHYSWDRAYGTDELYDWFLKHKLK